MLGARCSVLGARCSVLGARYSVFGRPSANANANANASADVMFPNRQVLVLVLVLAGSSERCSARYHDSIASDHIFNSSARHRSRASPTTQCCNALETSTRTSGTSTKTKTPPGAIAPAHALSPHAGITRLKYNIHGEHMPLVL